MYIDRIHFCVNNAQKWRDWFVQIMGFQSIASGTNNHTQIEIVSNDCFGTITFVLSSPLNRFSPVAQYLQIHCQGVSDIVFEVKDLVAIVEAAICEAGAYAIALGAKIQQPIQQRNFPQGQLKWCQINNPSGFHHTLIERTGETPILPDHGIVQQPLLPNKEVKFTGIDHLVLNVAAGDLETTVSWYERVFGFKRKQSFTIQTERSALHSQVIVHPISGIQFPINEPLSTNSQIQEFLDYNNGSGIQHIALKTSQIFQVTQQLRSAGLSFLSVPRNYYTELAKQTDAINLSAQEWLAAIEQEVLIDCQPEQQSKRSKLSAVNEQIAPILLQIFTLPIFDRPTFFFELIERRWQVKGFGENNFQALFEAMEREQINRHVFDN